MEPALKQRLIGASVLVALAVIFLPMLIKGPAPESGLSDVPMELPDAPQGEYETRELPLVTPGAASTGGVTGLQSGQPAADGTLPTVDTTGRAQHEMVPPPTEGGDYAVSFGSYASAADAQRVVDALRSSQLPGYQDTVSQNTNTNTATGGRTLYRVRIGPYGSQAQAEAARLRAAHVRDDVGAQVVTLDADTATPGRTAGAGDAGAGEGADAGTSASQPIAADTPSVAKPQALPESDDAAEPAKPARPATKPIAEQAPAARPTAAAEVGFAVQLAALSNTAEANKLRDRARAAGFDAFVETVRTEQGTLTRVLAGPVADRTDAERMKAQLAARLGVNGLVRSHP